MATFYVGSIPLTLPETRAERLRRRRRRWLSLAAGLFTVGVVATRILWWLR